MNKTSWFEELCSTAFMPHGQCYLWNSDLLWLHGVSDGLITLSYFSIPLTLLYFVRKRHDLPYPGLFILFGAFIVACGTTHLLEVITIWRPYYWVSGGIKAATALISIITAVALVRIVPQALALPSPEDLRRLNASLEEKVRERTADLNRANDELRREIAQRETAEGEVKRLNASLLHRLDEMQTLFDLLPVGVGIATDATGRDIRMNRALSRMLALPTAANASLSAGNDAAPRNFKVSVGGREVTPDELPMQTAVRENRPVLNVEETIERTDGVRLTALASAVPLQDEHGACRGCVATFQDISSLRDMEQRRRDLDRKLQDTQKLESLGVLAGGIAHDFNNLLTGILGNASLARSDLPATSTVLPALDQIEESTRRAADLCRQMLAYSGRGRFVVQSLDLNQLVTETTHLLRISISKTCVLRFNLAASLPAIQADATQMRQIVMNLVINASEAIGERSGVIALSTGIVRVDADYAATLLHAENVPPGDYVFLEVSDNGVGMDQATLARIFDPFFTTKFTGRGLGLAAVIGIIRGHHGALKVYSEPGRGSTFKILLPCADDTGTPAAAVTARDASWRGQGAVLVVDDEETIRTVAARILEAHGFSVVLANDGREALGIYRADPARFTLVLLDLTMPHLDGEETFRQLRHLNPGVKVVLMSGFNQQEAVSRFTGKGLAGFVQKPFAVDDLIRAARAVLLQA